jgi:hypothetical protein
MTLKSDAIVAGRWLRDHAPAFTVSFVTFTALWIAVNVAWLTLFTWDMDFYRSLAPPGKELTFMAAGFVFRMFLTAGGLAIVWLKTQKLNRSAGLTLRFIWCMGLVACGIAALGFVTEGNDYHYRKAGAVTQTETATTESADVTIKRATDEKAAIRADRDAQTASARKSMDLVLDDGNSNNDDVSQYEANIKKYTDDAQAKLDAQDAIIAAAEASRLTAKQTATQEAIGDPGLPAVFRAPARYLKGFDGLTFRDAFAIFWVILLEACGSVGAQALLAVQMALSKRKAAQEAGAKGGKTTARRNRVNGKLKAIEDLRQEKAAKEEIEIEDESDGELDGDVDGLEDERDGQEGDSGQRRAAAE